MAWSTDHGLTEIYFIPPHTRSVLIQRPPALETRAPETVQSQAHASLCPLPGDLVLQPLNQHVNLTGQFALVSCLDPPEPVFPWQTNTEHILASPHIKRPHGKEPYLRTLACCKHGMWRTRTHTHIRAHTHAHTKGGITGVFTAKLGDQFLSYDPHQSLALAATHSSHTHSDTHTHTHTHSHTLWHTHTHLHTLWHTHTAHTHSDTHTHS